MEQINIPTSNFVHCSFEWATLEIRCVRLFRDSVNCFSSDQHFWILHVDRGTFHTGRAGNFAWRDRASRTIGHTGKLADPLLPLDMSIGQSVSFEVFFANPLRDFRIVLPICHCVDKQEDTLNTDWVQQGVVLYSLLLNLCLCFYFEPIPSQVHAWVLSTSICALQGSRGI